MPKTFYLTKEDKWINEHFEELVDSYAGQYVAVVGEGIASIGATPWEVEKEAKKKYPGSYPSVLKVPRPQDFISILVTFE